MKYKLSVLITMVLLSGCSTSSKRLSIRWEVAQRLPQTDGRPHIGVAGPVTGIIGDRLLIAGGANFPEGMPWDGGKKAYQHRGYLYQIGAEDITSVREFDFPDSIAYAANISIDGHIYSAGGEGVEGAVSAVWKYSLDVHDQLQRTAVAPLPLALTNGSLVCIEDTLYFVGGENETEVSDKVYKLELKKEEPQWEVFLQLPYPLTHAVVASDTSSRIWIAGGRKRNIGSRSDMYDSVLQIDTKSKEIETLNTLPEPLAAGTGVWLANRLILIGGDDASTFHRVEDMLGEIGRIEAGARKDSLIAQKNTLLSRHPGFSKAVWALDMKSNTWEQLEDIAGESPVTTSAIVYKNLILIPSGEVKAGVRTDQILWGKLQNQ